MTQPIAQRTPRFLPAARRVVGAVFSWRTLGLLLVAFVALLEVAYAGAGAVFSVVVTSFVTSYAADIAWATGLMGLLGALYYFVIAERSEGMSNVGKVLIFAGGIAGIATLGAIFGAVA